MSKSSGPHALTDFVARHPHGSWDDFKAENRGTDYHAIRTRVFADQGQLCAYCEDRVSEPYRIEHFHPKSDRSDPTVNWDLDWENIIGVCIGGENANKELHPRPANLSCDAYKNHLVNTRQLPEACEGRLLNPLHLPPFPCLFELDKRTGELRANATACQQVTIEDNAFETVAELVDNTIRVLNLNCDRLAEKRIRLIHDYNREVKKAREVRDREFKSKLARRWFANRWLFLFTTRRILLGAAADDYLESIRFDG